MDGIDFNKCPICHKPKDKNNHDLKVDRMIIEKAMMRLEQWRQDDIITREI